MDFEQATEYCRSKQCTVVLGYSISVGGLDMLPDASSRPNTKDETVEERCNPVSNDNNGCLMIVKDELSVEG